MANHGYFTEHDIYSAAAVIDLSEPQQPFDLIIYISDHSIRLKPSPLSETWYKMNRLLEFQSVSDVSKPH
jgi:hypothetical protein